MCTSMLDTQTYPHTAKNVQRQERLVKGSSTGTDVCTSHSNLTAQL